MLVGSILAFSCSVLSLQSVLAETPIYRLYNRQNHEHLYTRDKNEKNVLYQLHGWGYEGIGWYAPDGGAPVYRLYNTGLQNHLYTSDLNEIDVLTRHYGWTKDNNGQPVFYSEETVPIFRVYNPSLRRLHHWTTDANECRILPSHDWRQEGIKFYAEQNSNPIRTQYAHPIAPSGQPAPQPPPLIIQTVLRLEQRDRLPFSVDNQGMDHI